MLDATEESLHPMRPSLGECQATQLRQNVDTVWRDAELEDELRPSEFIDGEKRKRRAEPGQCRLDAVRILQRGLHPDVEVLGETRFSVECDGIATDEEVTRLSVVQR